MKVVKLNRRFRQYKEHGHTVALKFPYGYTLDAGRIEKICKDRLDGHGWMRDGAWCHYYGERSGRDEVRPYWITFRNEADLTMILLSATMSSRSQS